MQSHRLIRSGSCFFERGGITGSKIQDAFRIGQLGKGKGEPEYWAAVVKPGMVLFEISGIPEAAARDCLARVAYKMPFRCRFVTRRPNL